MPGRSPAVRRLLAILGLAALLRLLRAALRWDEVSWLYAAYPARVVELLAAGRPFAAATTFTGLHPPLPGLLHALSERLLPVPALWLLGSAAASWVAVLLVARRRPLAGLLLATSPVQLHYAAEVNGYPLLMLAVAAISVARARAAEGGPRWPLLLAGLLGAWTHALGGIVAGLAALSLGVRGLPILAGLALGVLPLVPGVWARAAEGHTFSQPPLHLGLTFADARARFGMLALLCLPLWVVGARFRPGLGLGVLGSIGTIALFVGLGIAAPHQLPYLVILGAPLALLAEGAARGRLLRGALVVLALLQGGIAGGYDLLRGRGILADLAAGGRAIDLAWAESLPGDALVLLAPPGGDDDDKRLISPVLWRSRPWWRMPMVRPFDFDYADPRFGQPRLVQGRVVYVHDHLREAIAQEVDLHPRTFVVVSDPRGREEYTTDLAAMLGQEPALVGIDQLYRIQSTAGAPGD